MAHVELPPGLLPSLKDRLIDPDSMGTKASPGYGLQQVIESVRDDLEELLNTRHPGGLWETRFPELAKPIASYGMPDLASRDTSTIRTREEIGHIIEKAIVMHEPRLRNVRAVMVKPRGPDLSATFNINAELRVDPAPPM